MRTRSHDLNGRNNEGSPVGDPSPQGRKNPGDQR